MAEIKRSESADVKLYYDRSQEVVILEVPENYKNVEGEVHFYRPSDAKLDFKTPININAGLHKSSTKAIEKGKWGVKAIWKMEGKQYFKEIQLVK